MGEIRVGQSTAGPEKQTDSHVCHIHGQLRVVEELDEVGVLSVDTCTYRPANSVHQLTAGLQTGNLML